MKIEIDDNLFSDLAKELQTKPENIVKVFLEHAKDLPHSVWLDAIQEDSSLDSALEKLMKNAKPAFTIGHLIESIVGNRDYTIDDGDYDLEKGIIWFNVGFLEGDKGEINSIHLQFGSDSGQIVSASIQDLVLKKGIDEIIDEIYYIIDEFIEDEYNFEYDWIAPKYLTFTIQIDTTEILNLPKVDELEKMVSEIKKKIKSFDNRKNLV